MLASVHVWANRLLVRVTRLPSGGSISNRRATFSISQNVFEARVMLSGFGGVALRYTIPSVAL